MHIVIGILGIIFFLALAVLFSSDRKIFAGDMLDCY